MRYSVFSQAPSPKRARRRTHPFGLGDGAERRTKRWGALPERLAAFLGALSLLWSRPPL